MPDLAMDFWKLLCRRVYSDLVKGRALARAVMIIIWRAFFRQVGSRCNIT